MAREVIWSYEAAEDLEAMADYIARDSAYYASSLVQEIMEAGRSLDTFSERGRIVPELGNPKIREIFVRDYRLIYQREKSRIVILGIIYGKRDLKKLWKKEKRG